MKCKEFERVKCAPFQAGLNILVRKSAWAIHRYGATPLFLDGIQFKFINRTRKKTSDVKKLLVPDCIKS